MCSAAGCVDRCCDAYCFRLMSPIAWRKRIIVQAGLLWRPEMFRGRGHRVAAVDVWYYKIVEPGGRFARVVIPGVRTDVDPSNQYCFIRLLDGRTGSTSMHRYPYEQFWSSRDGFDVVCGNSHFSLDSLHLDIEETGLRVTGDLQFTRTPGWPVRPWAPGAMGPFAFLPFLEEYHAVINMDPRMMGVLSWDGEDIVYTGGRAYMEHDWGGSFPRAWIWTQSNHFDEDHVCLTACISDLVVGGRVVRGFIVGLLRAGVLYRWATWNASRLVRLEKDGRHAEFTVMNDTHVLEVWSGSTTGMRQVFTSRTGDVGEMMIEELQAIVQVRLLERHAGGDILLFEGCGRNGGLEIGADMLSLVRSAGTERSVVRAAHHPQGL